MLRTRAPVLRFHEAWTRSDGVFDVLAATGRDCAGALQLLPPGAAPDGCNRVGAAPLKDTDVEPILAGVTSDAALGQSQGDDLRSSIAGAQRCRRKQR